MSSSRSASPERSSRVLRGPGPGTPSVAALAVMVGGMLAVSAAFVAYVLATRPKPGLDMQVYWRAAQVLQGNNPTTSDLYDPVLVQAGKLELPFTYPPLSALAFYPLGGMTLEQAWTTMAVVGVLLTCVLAAVCLRLAPFSRDWFGVRVVPTLLAFAVFCGVLWNLYPSRFTIVYGQVNTMLAILILADLGRRARRRWGSGFLTGVAAGFKITPAAMGLVPLVQGRWRTLVGMAVGVATTIAVSAVFLPREVWAYFTSELWQTGRVGEVDRISNMSLNGLLHLWDLPDGLLKPVWLTAVLLVVAGGAAGIRRASRVQDFFSATVIGALVMLLISPITWEHHWVWVAPLMIALVPAAPRAAPAWQWAVALTLIGLVFWSFTSAPSVFAAQVLGENYPEVVLHGPPALERVATVPVVVAVLSGVWLALRPYPAALTALTTAPEPRDSDLGALQDLGDQRRDR